MPTISTNPDLPLSWRRPGTFVYFNLNSPGSAPGFRVLILGERDTTTAQLPANLLYRATSEQDVIDHSGAQTIVRLAYQSAIAQIGGGRGEVWVGHVDPDGSGHEATYQHMLSGTATGNGQIKWWLCGRLVSIGFSTGDLAADLASELAAAAAIAFANLPIGGVTSPVSGAVKAVVNSRSAWGEDMPSQFFVTPGKGLTIGPGDYVFATNATGAGAAKVSCGRSSYSFTLAGGETPGQIATGLAGVINAATGPLRASVNTGTLTLTFANGWPVRHVLAQITGSTGTTIAVNGSTPIAAGSVASNGVIGDGAPRLTALLGAIDNQSLVFRAWCCPWTDVDSLSALATAIETEGGGGGNQQRGQTLTICSTAGLATAGAIPSAPTPALTSSTRYALLWLGYESGNTAVEFAARVAAERAVNERPAKNFNGLLLKSTDQAPLLGPPTAGRSPGVDINAAIDSYFMAPLVWDDGAGRANVEHSRTTNGSSDRALHKWSLIHQLDEQRDRLRRRFAERFTAPDGTGVSLMLSGTPFSAGVVNLEDYEDAIYELTLEWERLGFYDGAEALKKGIKAQPDQSDPHRINAIYTASVLLDVDQVSVVANRGSVSQ